MSVPYKAVILAAGSGLRMLPLTKDKPKCLLEIGSQTILDMQITNIIDCGISEIILVVGYLGDKIKYFIKNSTYTSIARFSFIENKIFEKTGSCYSLWCCRDHLGSGYIHFNADLLFDCKLLQKLLDSKPESSAITGCVTDEYHDMVRFSEKDGRITAVGRPDKVPNASGILVGPIKFSSTATKVFLDEIEKNVSQGKLNDNCYLLIDKILSKINLYPLACGDLFWRELDTIAELRSYQRKFGPII